MEQITVNNGSGWKNFLIILLAGAFIWALLRSGCNQTIPALPVVTSPKILIREVEMNESRFKKTQDSIQQVNVKLQKDNAGLTTQIKQLKANARLMEDVIDNLPAGADTTVQQYISNCNEKDSLYDALSENYIHQLSNQTYLLQAKDSLYSKLRISFDTLASQQQRLIDYSNGLRRQAKKQKAGAIFWKVAAIAGGVYILKSSIK